MNKTLLLIICDFLLLNLLALTNWEKAAPARPEKKPLAAVTASPGAVSKDDDLVSLMKLSLEDERAQRDQLAQQLQTTQTALQDREQNLSKTAASLTEAQKTADTFARNLTAATQDATISKERLAQLQRDLEERQAEAARQKEQLAALQKQQTEAREKIENLNVAVKVAEQEKQLLRSTADTLKTQVESERQERQRVQATTTQLAQGVGQLAESSTALTKEIRENRPINANVLFSEFLANRVQTSFAARRPGLFGEIVRNKEARTIFVTDGRDTFALLHIEDTPFSLAEPGWDWNAIKADFSKGDYRAQVPSVTFLALDPRLVVLPVAAGQAASLGAKVYPVALEPFKFPDAVLISNGGKGYGEVPFKLDPTNPSYVRMDNRLVRRLFGDFSPSRGDLVLSKTGELLGIMVNNDYCALVNNFLPAQTVQTGDDVRTQPTSKQFDDLVNRLRKLPVRLQ